MWGMPLIEKQKSTVQVSNAERIIKELDKKIQDVIKNGGTQKLENINIPGILSLEDTELDDKIILKAETTGSDIAIGKDIYLKGDSEKSTYLGNEPSVVKVFSKDMGNEKYEITMTLYYRNVTGSENVYTIDIIGLGKEKISGDKHNIIITEGESPKGPSGIYQGKSVYTTKINVRFE